MEKTERRAPERIDPATAGRPCSGGVIASGSLATSEAGAFALEHGGNAIDAAVAAVFASFICEPVLTSAAGAGQMVVHVTEPAPRTFVLDFFADVPGRGLPPAISPQTDFFGLQVDFGSAVQEFHIGRGSVAVPGCVVGLCEVHRVHGRLPLSRVLEPALDLARTGIEVPPALAHVFQLLQAIITHSPEGRQMFSPRGTLLRAGDHFLNSDMESLLRETARHGADAFHKGPIAEALVEYCGPPVGRITAQDLEDYQVIVREPLVIDYRGHKVYTLPPPGAGGSYVQYGLELMKGFPVAEWAPHGAERLGLICGVLRLAGRHRESGALRPELPEHGDWVSLQAELALLLGESPTEGSDPRAAGRPYGVGCTTHCSVLDGEGNAVSVTTTCGESSGYVLPGTGVLLNNFMGEDDINPQGFFKQSPGTRMPTMMAPTLVERADGGWMALGTGGSNRIRSSMINVLSALLDCGLSPEEAVQGPRIHLDESGVYLEATGPGEEAAEKLHDIFPGMSTFGDRNFFFGGVHVARRCGDTGVCDGAGDPRRGGHVTVVPAYSGEEEEGEEALRRRRRERT